MPEQDEVERQPGEQPDDNAQSASEAQPDEVESAEGDLPQPVGFEATEDSMAHPGQDEIQPVAAESAHEPTNVDPPDEVGETVNHAAQSEQVERQEPAALQSEVEPPAESEPVQEPRRLSRAERETYDRQRRRFAACGRCSYFVADCRVYLGEEALQSAILDSSDGWVQMEGSTTFRRLLSNAYGVQLDVGYDYFDGSCPECRRRYVYSEGADETVTVKIRV